MKKRNKAKAKVIDPIVPQSLLCGNGASRYADHTANTWSLAFGQSACTRVSADK